MGTRESVTEPLHTETHAHTQAHRRKYRHLQAQANALIGLPGPEPGAEAVCLQQSLRHKAKVSNVGRKFHGLLAITAAVAIVRQEPRARHVTLAVLLKPSCKVQTQNRIIQTAAKCDLLGIQLWYSTREHAPIPTPVRSRARRGWSCRVFRCGSSHYRQDRDRREVAGKECP